MPQMTDSFLDRLVEMTQQSRDVVYRQAIVDEIRKTSMDLLPLETEVNYYERLATAPLTATRSPNAATIENQIREIRTEAVRAVEQVREIYGKLSANLNPGNQMLRIDPAIQHLERSVGIRRVALLVALSWLVGIPLIIIAALLYDRLRREEALDPEDGEMRTSP